MKEPLKQVPSSGGSYRRMPDGTLVPLDTPNMNEAQREAAARAREELDGDQTIAAAAEKKKPAGGGKKEG